MKLIPGSHGSLTKAGKVRQQTPTSESKGVNSRKKMIPRKRYKKLYKERIIEENFGAQPDSIGAKKAFYRH
ncbi:MAG: 30S ribosomal protein S30e [Candidatus Thorarchaeota archaeon]